MNNTDLLKQLCRLCPGWSYSEIRCGDGTMPRAEHIVNGLKLYVDKDEIHGGDALWFLIREMQRRWRELGDAVQDYIAGCGPLPTKSMCQERDALRGIMTWHLSEIAPDGILTTYINWRSAQKEGGTG